MLTQFQTEETPFRLMQNSWATQLNPMLANPSLQSIILQDISIIAGTNTINTKLGRKLQGWRIIRINAAATIYDAQSTNSMPDLTLVLISNAPATISLEVF